MTTWNEIIEIKLARIQAAKASRQKKQKRKKNFGCIGWSIAILISIFGLANFFESEEPNFDNFPIGSEVLYNSSFGDIELYQLGERKLSHSEQKKTNYEKTTAPQFERTNTISEKYFIDNSTNKIGEVLDTIPLTDGQLWLKIKLDKALYQKPINFDLLSDEFSQKLEVKKNHILTENLGKDFYLRVRDVNKGE